MHSVRPGKLESYLHALNQMLMSVFRLTGSGSGTAVYPGNVSDEANRPVEVSEQPDPAPQQSVPFVKRHPFLIYSVERLAVLVVAFAICYVLGARGIFLILLAFIISAVASYILFAGQRDMVGQRMGGYFSRMNQRIEAATHSEDAYVDSLVAESNADKPAAADKHTDNKNADDQNQTDQVDITDSSDQERSK